MIDSTHVDAYLDALLRGDRKAAVGVIDRALVDGLTIDQVQEEIIREAQHRIGQLWERDAISVAHEHLASGITSFALVHLNRRAAPEALKKERVLVACVEGELHDLPARLVSDALEFAGYDVQFLGANVPTRSLPTMIGTLRPDLLALSVTMDFNLPGLARAIGAARSTAPSMPIAIGGRAAWARARSHREQAGDLITAADARALVDEVDRRFGYRPTFQVSQGVPAGGSGSAAEQGQPVLPGTRA